MPLCHHGSQEVGLTAGPAPWLKTIKPKVEIGRSQAVTDNSGTNTGDCKFPLLTAPCPQTYTQPSGGGWVCVTHAHTSYSCWRHRGQVRRKRKAGPTLWVGLELWSRTNGWTEGSIQSCSAFFVFLFFLLLQTALKYEAHFHNKPLITSPCNFQASPCENYFYSCIHCDNSWYARRFASLSLFFHDMWFVIWEM